MEIKTNETKEELPSWLRTLVLRISIPDKKIDLVVSTESNLEQILDCPNSITFQKTNVGVEITCENCEKKNFRTPEEMEQELRSYGTVDQWALMRRFSEYMKENPGLYLYSSFPTSLKSTLKNNKPPIINKTCISTCDVALTVLKMFQDVEELHNLKYAKAEFLHPHNTITGHNIIQSWKL
ncbi:MAG: hypothetical protein WC556_00715 [Candidatus Methanoperedens sp.]